MSNAKSKTKRFNPKDKDNKESKTSVKSRSNRNSDAQTCDRDNKSRSHNDPSWYGRNPQLLKDVANIPFNLQLGAELPSRVASDFSNGSFNTGYDNQSIPGVLGIRMLNVPGISETAASPLNVAAAKNYSEIRYKNSGSSNYSSADLTMYFMAMDQCYSMWSHVVRAYGIAMNYSPFNKYYPRAMLSVMGFNPNIIDHLAELRIMINSFALKLSSMAVPNDMDYFSRHIYTYSNVFADSDSVKAQNYVFVPHGYWYYNQTKYDTGGALVYYSLDNVYLDIDGISDMFHRLGDEIWSDNAFNIMSGDILKYKGSAIISIPSISEDYRVIPVKNLDLLKQVNNAYAIGEPANTQVSHTNMEGQEVGPFDSMDIYQYDNKVIFAPPPNENNFKMSSVLINVYEESPDPSSVMYATRLTTLTKGLKISCGSELVVGFTMGLYRYVDGEWRFVLSTPSNEISYWVNTPYIDYSVIDDTTATTATNTLGFCAHLTNFDWHPRLLPIVTDSDSSFIMPEFGDLENTALIEFDILDRMNAAALLSLFDVSGHFTM